MTIFNRKRTLLSASFLGVIAMPLTAAEIALEEIVVTAERVEASLQETPISVAAFTSNTLKSLGVVESGDIANYTPNLIMDKTPASQNSYAIGIRGVQSKNPSLAIDPTVGIYLDGVYIARSSAAAFEIVDLERIEVLRGPQGTLYGRNTIGGAVNVITAKPTGEFKIKQDITVGERDLFRSSTSIDMPAFGDFAAKVSYNHGQRGGLVESSYTGKELGEYDQDAWRIALRWTPSESLSVDYTYDYYQQDSNTNYSQIGFVRPLQASLGGPQYELAQAAASAKRLGRLPYFDDSKDQTLEIDSHALTLNYDIGGATLKSISSWHEYDNKYDGQNFGDFVSDGNSMLTPNFDGTLVPAGSIVPVFTSDAGYNKHEQWSQELILVGDLLGGRLGYTVGAFYFHEEGRQKDPQKFSFPALLALGDFPASTQAFLCAGSCFGKSILLTAPHFKYDTDNDAWAVYAQFDYALTENLTAILGMRWSVDDKAVGITNEFSDVGLATLKEDDSWSNFNPTLTLTYAWSEDVMLYAKYATGYRAGGYNIQATTATGFAIPANEENIASWEVGGKSEWWGNRIRLNGALFYYDYEDQQVTQFEAGTGGASSKVVNAGKSNAQGIEIDLTLALTERMLVMLNYGHVEVEYDEFITSLSDPATGFPVFDSGGNAVQADISSFASTISGGPEDTAAAIIQYTFPVRFGTVVAQIDASYSSAHTFQTQLFKYDRADSYRLWNGRLELQDVSMAGGELTVALWGRNLGNEEIREFGIDFGALGFTSNTYKELRSVGIDLRYEF